MKELCAHFNSNNGSCELAMRIKTGEIKSPRPILAKETDVLIDGKSQQFCSGALDGGRQRDCNQYQAIEPTNSILPSTVGRLRPKDIDNHIAGLKV